MLPIVIDTFNTTNISMFAPLLRTATASINSNGTWTATVDMSSGILLTGTYPTRAAALDWMCAQISA